eukprot:s1754_g5.t1
MSRHEDAGLVQEKLAAAETDKKEYKSSWNVRRAWGSSSSALGSQRLGKIALRNGIVMNKWHGKVLRKALSLCCYCHRLIWNFKVLKQSAELSRPASGCLAYGIFVDGARWDDDDSVIAESLPKVLFSGLPTIHLTPCETSKDPTDRRTVYPSPLYKTSGRKGTLTTTGHSTNFVMTLLLPSLGVSSLAVQLLTSLGSRVRITKQHTEKYWAKRGVACLLQLDD